MDDGRQTIVDELRATATKVAAHHEYWKINTCFTQFDGLFDQRDTQTVRTCAFQGTSAHLGAVPVGVGLEHTPDFCARVSAQRSQVMPQVAQPYFGPRGSQHLGNTDTFGAWGPGSYRRCRQG